MATATVTPQQLSEFTDLTVHRLRALAREGWLPRAEAAGYQLLPALKGLLRYYRERDKNRALQDSYDTLRSCAAATGIPLSVLKEAKRAGGAGFKGSRVYLGPVLQGVFGDAAKRAAEQDELKLRAERARASLLDLRRKEKEGLVVDAELAKQAIAAVLVPLRAQLLAMPAALSAQCNPSDPDYARDALERGVDDILTRLEKGT